MMAQASPAAQRSPLRPPRAGNAGPAAAYDGRRPFASEPAVSRIAQAMRGLFEFKPAPPDRVRFSLRASACIGAPVMAGRLAGDITAAMLVAI